MDAGLERVVAAETILSDVQGDNGRLIIRGLDVDALARDFSFEDTARHLWAGYFSRGTHAPTFGAARVAAFERLKPHFGWLGQMPEVEALRAALSLVPDGHASAGRHRPRRHDRRCQQRIARPEGWSSSPPTRSHARPRGGPAAHDAERRQRSDAEARPRGLSRDGLRSRPQRLDIRGALRGVHARRPRLGGGGCAVRAEGPAARHARRARCSTCSMASAWPACRRAGSADALDRGERLMGFGHRVYRTRHAIPAPTCSSASSQASPQAPAASPSPSRSKAASCIASPPKSLTASSTPMSNTTPPSCSKPSASPAASSPRCSRAATRHRAGSPHAQEQARRKRLVRPASVYHGADCQPGALRGA